MQLHRLYQLRPRELRAIQHSLGGKYPIRDRLKRDGTGSPFMYYVSGHEEIDTLNDRCVDLLRINFEEYQNGLMLGVTERTEPYILPLQPGDIKGIEVKKEAEEVKPQNGSLFNWLLERKIGLSFARFFAGAKEYEEAKTLFVLETTAFTLNAWITIETYENVVKFFKKSKFNHLLKVE